MRAYVPAYQLISPASLGEALDALARDNGAWKPFAGGTDLMVLLEAGKLPPDTTAGTRLRIAEVLEGRPVMATWRE